MDVKLKSEMPYWIYIVFLIGILNCVCLNQDLPNQEINGMNACRRSPKSTPNARMAFVQINAKCAYGIRRV